MAQNPVVELDGALVLWKDVGLHPEAGDDVVAAFTALYWEGELATAPVVHLHIRGVAEEGVKSAEPIIDGGIFELGIEDVHRLILTRHAWAILPLVVTAPRWLPKREEGKCGPAA